ncbi:transposase domain protein [Burkholderia thailandensis MSMB121]|nr:transposase domain protein [Burkholderia thailandensis MSMB121]
MSSRGEGFLGDFGQESGSGPDADSRHAGQDWPKRVSKHQPLNFGSDFATLLAQGGKLLGQTRHDDGGGLRAGHDYGLLVQRLNDFGRQVLAHARCELGQAVGERLFIGSSKCARDG